MRLTIRLPDDLLEKVTLDALKKRRNSKEAVIAEILREHYGGEENLSEKFRAALGWKISGSQQNRIESFRQRVKKNWK